MTSAVSAMEAAYTDGAGRLPTSASFVDVGAGNIGGMNLIPGVYKWSTGVLIPTDVTLSGGPNDVWIFVIPGTLDLSSGKQVILSGGAQPQNIFWVVAGTTTLEPDSTFNGNILDQTLIRLQTRAILNGKALAQTADTLDTTTVNGPSVCTIPGSITLTPATATNTLGQTHTVTATVKDANGNLVVGKQVTFVVTAGPDTGTTVTSVTDVNGQTTFTYVGNVAGTDHIIASFADTTGATILSNEVTKTWVEGTPVAQSITLTPATATNTLGQTHTVTATVKDANGNLVVGKQVTFVVTAGPDTGTTVTSVTDVNGQTTFTYVGNVAGTDHIIASFVDTTGATILSNEVTKTWEQGIPVPEFPIIVLPLGMLLGLVFIITSSRRRE
jgi:protocatechuate 3,4-dioxygenase beta subunit